MGRSQQRLVCATASMPVCAPPWKGSPLRWSCAQWVCVPSMGSLCGHRMDVSVRSGYSRVCTDMFAMSVDSYECGFLCTFKGHWNTLPHCPSFLKCYVYSLHFHPFCQLFIVIDSVPLVQPSPPWCHKHLLWVLRKPAPSVLSADTKSCSHTPTSPEVTISRTNPY